jgi:hypothetical protein
MTSTWRVHGSAGIVHQIPEVQWAPAGGTNQRDHAALGPERALNVDVGIRRDDAAGLTWGVTLFARGERDVIRLPETPDQNGRPDNALRGLARGLEVLVERRTEGGLGGWVAYAIGTARYTDVASRESFAADFDRRHVLSAGVRYRSSNGVGLGATLRAASSLPTARRLPPYARLDLHAERLFLKGNTHVILFADVTNALDRSNTSVTDGWGQRLYPRLFSAGVRIGF